MHLNEHTTSLQTALIFYRLAPDSLLLSYWINVHYLLCMWSANLQLLMHVVISLNRYTAICRPVLHLHVGDFQFRERVVRMPALVPSSMFPLFMTRILHASVSVSV